MKCGTERANVSTVPSASIRTSRPSSAPQPPESLTNSVPSGAKAGQFGKPRSGATRTTVSPSYAHSEPSLEAQTASRPAPSTASPSTNPGARATSSTAPPDTR